MKKMLRALLLISAAVFTFWSVWYVRKSGVLRAYPDTSFMTKPNEELRVMYQNLSEKEKAVYTALYEGIKDYKEYIELPYNIDGDVYDKIYQLLEKQESEFFYIDSVYYNSEKIRQAKIVYRVDRETAEKMKSELEKKRDEIKAGIGYNMEDYEKAAYIHDYLAKNCVYRVQNSDFVGTAYGCLVEGYAHCEGYAKAFDYLLKELKINDVVITGVTDDGENHAWNKFKCSDGKWYNADVTWDDTDNTCEGRHIYFMSSDEAFEKSHFADNTYSNKKLVINKNTYGGSGVNGYYKKEKNYISEFSECEKVLKKELGRFEEKGFLEVELADEDLYDKFKAKYFESEGIFDLILEYKPELVSEHGVTMEMVENKAELCIIIMIKTQ